MTKKHIHFIGICGVGMGALAVMFKKMGWKVTGSDKGFFPPISEHLKKAKINFYPGWHPENIGSPQIVVVGNFISLKNPEYLKVVREKLNIKSFPELVKKYIIKKNSIVVAGTYAKTTISAFLTHILKQAKKNPSWFVGGIAPDLENGAYCGQSEWSVTEGDEYSTARWDIRSKFLWYKPTHLILSSIIWDHVDIFPREKDYLTSFAKLIKLLPPQGKILASIKKEKDKNLEKIISLTNTEIIRYGEKKVVNGKKDYSYEINSLSSKKSCFTIYNKGRVLEKFETKLFGEHMIENLTAGIAMCHTIGVELNKIKKATKNFQGVKRRLELKSSKKDIFIFDDLAHSPVKAKSSLMAIRLYFPKARIFAVYEPNVGNRTETSKKFYEQVFSSANFVLIPRLSKTKTNTEQEKRMNGEELAKTIKEKNKKNLKVFYFEADNELVHFLETKTKPGDVIIFLGSHSFRGMIEQSVRQISSK